MPSQSSVEPLEGVILTRGMLITRAKGWDGWLKSASEWTGWRCGVESGVAGSGGMAEFAEQKVHLGRGPRREEVICVAIASVI